MVFAIHWYESAIFHPFWTKMQPSKLMVLCLENYSPFLSVCVHRGPLRKEHRWKQAWVVWADHLWGWRGSAWWSWCRAGQRKMGGRGEVKERGPEATGWGALEPKPTTSGVPVPQGWSCLSVPATPSLWLERLGGRGWCGCQQGHGPQSPPLGLPASDGPVPGDLGSTRSKLWLRNSIKKHLLCILHFLHVRHTHTFLSIISHQGLTPLACTWPDKWGWTSCCWEIAREGKASAARG